MTDTVVLAFSGGLDTSYCAVQLREQGYNVVTCYAHSGNTDPDAIATIEARALELGVTDHRTLDVGPALWEQIVLPFLAGGARRQGRYPVLCADRYLIAARVAELAEKTGAAAIAHGCTGMGNDQVRFDVSLAALTNSPVFAPIRDIQHKDNVRAFEISYLKERGVAVADQTSRYSINENFLGATLSGGTIDQWREPEEDARLLTLPGKHWPREPHTAAITFEEGRAVALNGSPVDGPELLATLNSIFGRYGVGYDIYTGDTLVGLKGRIVFEAPGLAVLEAAHTALCEAVSSQAQNAFRRQVGEEWVNLIYDGRYFDPLRNDLEAFLHSSQTRCTGEVVVRTEGGSVHAVALDTPHILQREDSVYAQKAAWSGEAARGFTELLGQSTVLWHQRG